LRALEEVFGLRVPNLRVAVLGAGGAGRAVAAALAGAGAGEIYLWNRSRSRAERLIDLLRERHALHVARLDEGPTGPRLPAGVAVDLVVNATSAGLGISTFSPADPADFPGTTHAMDLVYGREPSPFLSAFSAAGARTSDGRAMLLHQGARAFELWFKQPAPLEVMRSALADALARRA
jgi:shikimate dehydrogenase